MMPDIKLIETILGTQKRKIKNVPQSIRTKLLIRSEGKCERCHKSLKGLTPHIHHIDGERKNNKISNLIVLCPNCHSKTPTYKKPKTKTSPSDIWGIKQSFF